MIRRVLLPALLGATLLWGAMAQAGTPAPWADLPSDAAVARARVTQDILPALNARHASAKARYQARDAFFQGTASLNEAFPDLSRTRLDEPAVLSGLLVRLDEAAVTRMQAQIAPLPSLDARTVTALITARDRTLRAEERADGLRRRLLLGIRAHLESHPSLAAANLAPIRAPLERELAIARSAGGPPDSPGELARVAHATAVATSLTRIDLLAEELRARALVPRPDPVDVAPELAVLAGGQTGVLAEAALHRLRLAMPWLEAEVRTAVEGTEAAWLAGPVLDDARARLALAEEIRDAATAAVTDDPVVLEAALALADAQVELQQGVVDGTPDGPDGSAAALRKQLSTVELAIDVAARDAAKVRLDLATGQRNAKAQVDKQSAAAAAAAAEGQEASAASHLATRDLLLKIDGIVQELETERKGRAKALDETGARIAHMDTLPLMSVDREDPDALYKELHLLACAGCGPPDGPPSLYDQFDRGARAVVDELADVIPVDDVRAARLAEVEEWATAEPDGERKTAALGVRDALVESFEERDAAIRRVQAAARHAHGEMLTDLRRVRRQRRALESHASSDLVRGLRGDLVEEVREEVSLLWPQVRWIEQRRGEQLLAAPVVLLSRSHLLEVISRSFMALLLIFGWWLARRRASRLASSCLRSLERVGFTLSGEERRSLLLPVRQLIVPLLDAVLALVVSGWMHALAPELGFLNDLAGRFALYRAIRAVAHLAVSDVEESWPALFVAGEDSRRQWDAAVRAFGVWFVGRWVVVALFEYLLVSETIASTLQLGLDVVALAAALVTAYRWEPRLVARMREAGPNHSWLDSLLAWPEGGIGAPLRAVVLGAWLGGLAAWDLVDRRAVHTERLGALASLMDRARMGEVDDEGLTRLDPERLAPLLSDHVRAGGTSGRPACEERLLAAFVRWQEVRRRGLVVMTGDRGDGKGVLLERLVPGMLVEEHLPTRGRLRRRLTTEAEALAWLAELFELKQTPRNGDGMVRALEGLEPRVIVLERVERAFLREVEGFEALKTLLYVANVSSDRHFWLFAMHRPSWAYLSRLGTVLNTSAVVREVVDLTPLNADEMKAMILRRTAYARLDASFDRVRVAGPFGRDPTVARERAESSYFRLLNEAASGCPGVGLLLWAACLREDANGKVQVVVDPTVDGGVVDNLGQHELFVLTALRIHVDLTLDEIQRVVNSPAADVRATVRALEQRGLVELSGTSIRIVLEQLKRVNRTLRRHHFLQWRL